MGLQPGAPRKWHLQKGDCSSSGTTPPPPPPPTRSLPSPIKDARLKVEKTIRLFNTVRNSILEHGDVGRCRVDREAARIVMRDRPATTNVGNKMVGPVSGILVGDKFRYRVELRLVGIHRPTESGIDYTHFHGTTVAISVVACEHYGDDLSHQNRLTYTGQGGFEAEHIEGRGLALSNRKKPQDQQLVRGNLALAHNVKHQIPVRVIRAYKSRDGGSIYVYDGLYLVDKFWQERGPQGNLVFMFQLSRMEGEGNQPVRS
ncbi:hypothetical protein M0R45_024870 [Rubus argutus]|uniref:YDG domain-containing protein n=1 Tax=Rubus argutus TaxID=59490 RepID=A0AAW1WSA4_RUBAR